MFKKTLPLLAFCLLMSPLATALDYSQLPDPLKDIQVGQWVTYPVSWDEEDGDKKQTVTKIEGEGDARVVTLLREILVGGEVTESEENAVPYPELAEEMRSMFEEAEGAVVSSAKVDVNGKELDCVLLTYTEDGTECKIYLSGEIPILGIVKFEMEGVDEPIMAVKDYRK